MKRWYAVQHGSNYDCDHGSTRKKEAVKMANALKKDPDFKGEEIRIALIDMEHGDFCDGEIIIREGSR